MGTKIRGKAASENEQRGAERKVPKDCRRFLARARRGGPTLGLALARSFFPLSLSLSLALVYLVLTQKQKKKGKKRTIERKKLLPFLSFLVVCRSTTTHGGGARWCTIF